MDINRERVFHYIGSAFVVLAICTLTVFPFFINQIPYIMISIEKLKTFAAVFYLAAFILYFFAPKYFKKQAVVMLLGFIFFLLFQAYVKNL